MWRLLPISVSIPKTSNDGHHSCCDSSLPVPLAYLLNGGSGSGAATAAVRTRPRTHRIGAPNDGTLHAQLPPVRRVVARASAHHVIGSVGGSQVVLASMSAEGTQRYGARCRECRWRLRISTAVRFWKHLGGERSRTESGTGGIRTGDQKSRGRN